ncbi:spore coat protein [Priestia megaterium]|uniref:spore coat protein n=1 Tax=Priestia megaterium TaxID=1404 RepID=UPI002076B8DE|nr:spore coat protein [Priestia megaterium]USD17765.1 spore coat protein [Priestia megaterium]USD18856.1 spore coat protein [Priestia megaterium]
MYPRPTKCMPPIVHPTKCCTQFTSQEVVVPHIHPSHNTLVNHTNVKHVHYFPQTQSVVNETSNQQFFGGAQQYPTQVGGAGYPGQVGGAGYPGQVAGAGYPGQVGGAGYPGQMGGYPGQMGGYPGQVAGAGYPGQVAGASYPGHKGCGQGSCHTKGAHQGPNSGYFR